MQFIYWFYLRFINDVYQNHFPLFIITVMAIEVAFAIFLFWLIEHEQGNDK